MSHETVTVLSYLFFMIFGYLSGSIMYSQVLPLKLRHINIRKISDDGNPGAGNVFKNVGVSMGLLCLICDIIKGAIPVALCLHYLSWNNLLFALVLIAPVLGHARFGKAIATSFGVLLGLLPKSLLVFYLAIPFVFFSVVVRITPHAWRVIISFLLFFVGTVLQGYAFPLQVAAFCIALIVIVKHVKYLRSLEEVHFHASLGLHIHSPK